jgi:hypothetical protein
MQVHWKSDLPFGHELRLENDISSSPDGHAQEKNALPIPFFSLCDTVRHLRHSMTNRSASFTDDSHRLESG